MTDPLASLREAPLIHVANPGCRKSAYPEALRAILSLDRHREAYREVSGWDGYAPTTLLPLARLADAIGVARIWYKDEGGRFGLSFKALGAGYAASALMKRLAGTGPDLTKPTLCAATDGNHGRALAWAAQRLGCPCHIYVHSHVSEPRCDAIRRYGATLVRVSGTYDDSVRRARDDAHANGWHVVSDTSWPGYTEIPRDVMQGYTVLVEEALMQLPPEESITHVFLQAGVGSFAASVCAHLWERFGEARPRIVVVEPANAACLLRSARAGAPTIVPGELRTAMAGLACGEPSMLAWEILAGGASDFLALEDAGAFAAMRLLAQPRGDDPCIVAGESAVAGLAALIATRAQAIGHTIGLNQTSRVLVIGTEADTDPVFYREVIEERVIA